MSTNNFFKSDIFGIYNIIQASMLVYPKEMIIATLEIFFLKMIIIITLEINGVLLILLIILIYLQELIFR